MKKTILERTKDFDTDKLKKPNPLDVLHDLRIVRDALDNAIEDAAKVAAETKTSLVKLLGDHRNLSVEFGNLASSSKNYAKQQAENAFVRAHKDALELSKVLEKKISHITSQRVTREDLEALRLRLLDLEGRKGFLSRCWNKIKSIFS
jgi:hypothetical protein